MSKISAPLLKGTRGRGQFHSPIYLLAVENKGLEPLTPCVQGRCSKPTELIPRSLPVVPRRVELRTSTLSVWRSNQLSYETIQTEAYI